MQFLKVRNFEKYQHYHNRRPPWVKLYRDLWLDPNFYELNDSDKLYVIGCFTLASETDNKIQASAKWMQKRLSISKAPNIKALLASGFLEPIGVDASTVLATCYCRDRSTETDSASNASANMRSASKEAASTPPQQPIISLPLADKSEYHLTRADLTELSNLYPGVDPEKELLKAKGWLIANPTRRKTPRGIARFLHGWLGRAQDRGNGSGSKSRSNRQEETQNYIDGLISEAEKEDRGKRGGG